MKTSKLISLFMVICLITSACSSGIIVADPIIPTNTKQPEFTATNNVQVNTSTPTIPTEIPTPTEEPTPTIVPTETLVPTPTEILPFEWDIDPYIIREIDHVYKGIRIKARLIIDRSLEPFIEDVEIVREEYVTEFIAKSIATIWYERQGNKEYLSFMPYKMNKWFELWAKAQETGSEYYWRQVQLDNIWINDLNDGDGYTQKPYSLWPMCERIVPSDITAFDNITIVLFDTASSGVYNMTPIPMHASNKVAISTNLNKSDLIFYSGVDFQLTKELAMNYYNYSSERSAGVVLNASFSYIRDWIILNKGQYPFSEYLGWDVSKLGSAIKYKLRLE